MQNLCWNLKLNILFAKSSVVSPQVPRGEVSVSERPDRVKGWGQRSWPWQLEGWWPGSWSCWLCWRWLMLPFSCPIKSRSLDFSETGVTFGPTSSSSSLMTKISNWVSGIVQTHTHGLIASRLFSRLLLSILLDLWVWSALRIWDVCMNLERCGDPVWKGQIRLDILSPIISIRPIWVYLVYSMCVFDRERVGKALERLEIKAFA